MIVSLRDYVCQLIIAGSLSAYFKKLQIFKYERITIQGCEWVWRIAFAYDPRREAILLVVGNKAGVGEKRFYRELIRKADERFSDYLRTLK
jgi:hypothetical protein